MHCEKTPLVERLAVDQPGALDSELWLGHLKSCGPCRRARFEYAASLALYRQLEADSRSRHGGSGDWERLSRAIDRRVRRGQPRITWRATLAAAVGGVIVFGTAGTLAYMVRQSQPRPARIVDLQPQQRSRVIEILHQSLDQPANLTGAVSGIVARQAGSADAASEPVTPASTARPMGAQRWQPEGRAPLLIDARVFSADPGAGASHEPRFNQPGVIRFSTADGSGFTQRVQFPVFAPGQPFGR
ncbi:MAG: hypothetical protein HY423_14480 [Candidatus Lambdaproteobacteria bacterium]|nr:hypothetical protein [Candidatus Lambdaproteobacteria bacterium]